MALPGFTRLDRPEAVGALKRWSVGALDLRNESRSSTARDLSFWIDLSCWLSRCRFAVRVVLTRNVHTTTLYKPTKCQNVRGGGRARDSAGGSCAEIDSVKRVSMLVDIIESGWLRS